MQKQIISISKGQYISDLNIFQVFGIISNTIWNKTIPGCGFTRYAIEFFLRHLICILPNVPVIVDKVHKHNEKHPDSKILGVYKGIDVEDIKAYLRSDVKYKKILTTPEGFIYKVLLAFEDLTVMRSLFFLLIDESERIVTDVSYRGDIAAPIDELFKFKNKALVSATTLPFTDERFNDFEHYTIEPDYDFSQPLTLISTNNVAASIKSHLDNLNSAHICIFINSTTGIKAIAENVGIEAESKAFCAEESVASLALKKYKHASSHFSTKDMAKYNFFTSRYFSAVDIELDYKPDVILVTDVIFADHSILDPHTEVIQIAGRFRNGIKSITHITNFNPKLQAKSESEALNFLQGRFETYQEFVQAHAIATNPGSKFELERAIKNSKTDAFYIDGKLNQFMIDNYLYEERVKGYYQNVEQLERAYGELYKHFSVTHKPESYTVGDSDLQMLSSRQTLKEKYKVVAELLHNNTSRIDHFVFGKEEFVNKIAAKYPKITQAFYTIGLSGLEATGYVMSVIEDAVREAKERKEIERLAPYVYAFTSEFGTFETSYLLNQFTSLYSNNNIKKVPYAADIKKYYVAHRSSKYGVKVYKTQLKRFPDIDAFQSIES
jgi:hypothetical protein